ncbi:MBL fold metallo-hydrolase [Rhizobium paknamense]|uniref:Glyoxylase-like metal-dependent hydrolase (Beta-lactamase superfamily II) n=1 Tax=Rhizobium paknamense TaxID=1206817 RepID=A0ABU0IC05_9HYPH|nr:MBL fold metallo-hydrolase [Rhizobium paknamense]MDQ0455168.1 glyoxylase-like metal-dependent hydrolase (beta-lactamase superfamily II) [Rhizobium paknamense]
MNASWRLAETYQPAHGEAVPLAPGVQRVTAGNVGAMTHQGTNSYIVGEKSVCVIDPGPEDEAHFQALLRALEGREVTHILVTHTHKDHSMLAPRLKAEKGGLLVAEGAHRLSRPLHPGEVNPFAKSSHMEFTPDLIVSDGALLQGDGWALETVLTPGHAANHACFALRELGVLFSGDHVMAWATSVVGPPDGSMAAYLASLDKLLARQDRFYLPGHGGPVTEPRALVSGMRTHRLTRERAILGRVRAGDHTIEAMVQSMYRGLEPGLLKPAALSVFAHLEDLVRKGEVVADGPACLDSSYYAV